MIRGTSFINGVSLTAIIDIGATHSFISHDWVNNLNLEVSSMIGSKIIDTLANGTTTTLMVFLNCALTIYGKEFGVDLIYLPMSQLDVILGMNWLEFNHVNFNCFDKTVLFPKFEESMNSVSCPPER